MAWGQLKVELPLLILVTGYSAIAVVDLFP
jgi:hypothetical protein